MLSTPYSPASLGGGDVCLCGNDIFEMPNQFQFVTADGQIVRCMKCQELHDMDDLEQEREMEAL